MAISRDTFDPSKNYKRLRFHQDRDLLDSELNEQQAIALHEQKKINDLILPNGAVISGLAATALGHVLTVTAGTMYVDGCIESHSQTALSYDPLKTSGADYVYAELTKYVIDAIRDPGLVNDITGEPTAEREKWVVALRERDTSADPLPDNALERKVIRLYKFDRETGNVSPIVQTKSNLYLKDLSGSLPGSRITVASVSEDRLALSAAEGRPSLLHNLAQRSLDCTGSYVVYGLDALVASVDGGSVRLIMNAGKAYIEGLQFQRNSPTLLSTPLAGADFGRKDIVYATAQGIGIAKGAPAAVPKAPVAPDGALLLAVVDLPAGSADVRVHNLARATVTMDQLYQLMRDVDVLKQNDARSRIHDELLTREATLKKGIYTDDFSSVDKSDTTHPEWSARVDTAWRIVAPNRSAASAVLQVDAQASNVFLTDGLALLPATEVTVLDQSDWSEEIVLNPQGAFFQPEATLHVSPGIGGRGATAITVTGAGFLPNATGVSIKCDGQTVTSGLQADAVGRVPGTFTIPAAARTGTRVVEMTDGTNTAEAVLLINDPLAISRIQRIETDLELRVIRKPASGHVWRERNCSENNAPLAQTFHFPQTRIVSAIGIHCTRKDTAAPLTVQVRRLAGGLPGGVVLAEKVLAPSEIQLNAETKVTFTDPLRAEANVGYAVVFLTGSSEYAVRVATLGQMGQNGVVTQPPEMLLLEGKDPQVWTPREQSRLTMRVYGYVFEGWATLLFQPLSGVQFSDLNLDEYSSIPEGTSITWEYSTDGGTIWNALVPAEEEQLPAVAGQVRLKATLSSTKSFESPALVFRDVNLVGYLNGTTGIYVTTPFQTAQGIASAKLYTQMNIPAGTTMAWYASNDGGTTWELMTQDGNHQLDEDWTEYVFTRTFTNAGGTQIRFKAEMIGTTLSYPRIHTLGSTLV